MVRQGRQEEQQQARQRCKYNGSRGRDKAPTIIHCITPIGVIAMVSLCLVLPCHGRRISPWEDMARTTTAPPQLRHRLTIELTIPPLLECVGTSGSTSRSATITTSNSTRTSTSTSTNPSKKNGSSSATGDRGWQEPPPPQLLQPEQLQEHCREQIQQQQQFVWERIQAMDPKAQLLATTQKIANTIHVELTQSTRSDTVLPGLQSALRRERNDPWIISIRKKIRAIPGVQHVITAELWYPVAFAETSRITGIQQARQAFCVTGKGVRIAVLDSGVDYTHSAMAGPGTRNAYREVCGSWAMASVQQQQQSPPDAWNNRTTSETYSFTNPYFPSERIVGGINFVPTTTMALDPNPCDTDGHGTMVADAILSNAPEVGIIAIRVCSSDCYDFAVLKGIEYALDPNNDGQIDDRVDIINLSLGRRSTSWFYSPIAKALERAFAYGVLPIVAVGNDGNIPYVAGGTATAPNSLSVGATTLLTEDNHDSNGPVILANYSSRGPGENNIIKPDIVAPGGPFVMATVGTGSNFGSIASGTSFAAPVVTAAAAMLKQRCSICGPLAIKALLMNTANHTRVWYDATQTELAPVSATGSGMLNVYAALDADVWAYNVDEAQPSISLGLVNAAGVMQSQTHQKDPDQGPPAMILTRTIRVINIAGTPQRFQILHRFRSKQDQDSGAVTISFSQSTILEASVTVNTTVNTLELDGSCQSEVTFQVIFSIDASRAPTNHMTFAGSDGIDPILLDRNEVDGWIILSAEDTGKETTLPFHMILRKAAHVTVQNTELAVDAIPGTIPVGMHNRGEGTAQIDAYELLYTSEDNPEPDETMDDSPSDFRYIGYRLVDVNQPGCGKLIEFAITTWERKRTLQLDHFFVNFYSSPNAQDPDLTLYNAGFLYDTPHSECRLYDTSREEDFCTGFPPDHSTNTANKVLRACVDDLLPWEEDLIIIVVGTLTFPNPNISDVTEPQVISLKHPALYAPSYNIDPGQTLRRMVVSGTGITPWGDPALGLLLFTNGYRDRNNTGAATKETESIVIRHPNVSLPLERTPDVIAEPRATNFDGPMCPWNAPSLSCPVLNRFLQFLDSHDIARRAERKTSVIDPRISGAFPVDGTNICPIFEVPRSLLATQAPSEFPSFTPSFTPSQAPSISPQGEILPSARPQEDAITTPSPQIESLRPESPPTMLPPSASVIETSKASISYSNLLVVGWLTLNISSCVAVAICFT